MMRYALLLLILAGCASDPAAVSDAPEPLAPEAADEQPLATKADSSWTIEATDLSGTAENVTVRTVRLAAHTDDEPGYDRIVFEFDSGQPGVHVEYVDKPVRACGSGDQLFPAGDGYLEIRLTGARGHTETGEATISHERERRDLPAVLETVPTCDFEGEVTWVLGVTSPEAYRVARLRAPDRLVIDVQHP